MPGKQLAHSSNGWPSRRLEPSWQGVAVGIADAEGDEDDDCDLDELAETDTEEDAVFVGRAEEEIETVGDELEETVSDED